MTTNEKNIAKVILVCMTAYGIYLYVNRKQKEKDNAKALDSNIVQPPTADVVIDIVNADLPKTEAPKDNFAHADGVHEVKKEAEPIVAPEPEPVAQEEPIDKADVLNAMEWFKANRFDIGRLEKSSDKDIITLATRQGWTSPVKENTNNG